MFLIIILFLACVIFILFKIRWLPLSYLMIIIYLFFRLITKASSEHAWMFSNLKPIPPIGPWPQAGYAWTFMDRVRAHLLWLGLGAIACCKWIFRLRKLQPSIYGNNDKKEKKKKLLEILWDPWVSSFSLLKDKDRRPAPLPTRLQNSYDSPPWNTVARGRWVHTFFVM